MSQQGHHTSVLMRVFAALDFLLFMISFVAMLSRISALSATVFGFFSIAMVFVLATSQEHAKKQRLSNDHFFCLIPHFDTPISPASIRYSEHFHRETQSIAVLRGDV